jgi:DNA-binding Xre family transcriptional regulator
MAKLARNENVNVDTLVRICLALGCEISDIIEIFPDEADSGQPQS